MKLEIRHECTNFDSFRANKVKSLFNPDMGIFGNTLRIYLLRISNGKLVL